MKNINIYCSWELKFDLFNEKQIELYVDTIPTSPVPDNVVRFVFLLEPSEILNLEAQAIWGEENRTYNYLLTHNENLLKKSNIAHLFEFGTTWIKEYDFPKKNFSVSTLVGGKLMAPGHLLRQKLWENIMEKPGKK